MDYHLWRGFLHITRLKNYHHRTRSRCWLFFMVFVEALMRNTSDMYWLHWQPMVAGKHVYSMLEAALKQRLLPVYSTMLWQRGIYDKLSNGCGKRFRIVLYLVLGFHSVQTSLLRYVYSRQWTNCVRTLTTAPVKYLGQEKEACQLKAAVFCANPWNIEICSVNLQKSLIGLEIYSKAIGTSTRRLFEQYVLIFRPALRVFYHELNKNLVLDIILYFPRIHA